MKRAPLGIFTLVLTILGLAIASSAEENDEQELARALDRAFSASIEAKMAALVDAELARLNRKLEIAAIVPEPGQPVPARLAIPDESEGEPKATQPMRCHVDDRGWSVCRVVASPSS